MVSLSNHARLASKHPASSTGQAFEQPALKGVFQQPVFVSAEQDRSPFSPGKMHIIEKRKYPLTDRPGCP